RESGRPRRGRADARERSLLRRRRACLQQSDCENDGDKARGANRRASCPGLSTSAADRERDWLQHPDMSISDMFILDDMLRNVVAISVAAPAPGWTWYRRTGPQRPG